MHSFSNPSHRYAGHGIRYYERSRISRAVLVALMYGCFFVAPTATAAHSLRHEAVARGKRARVAAVWGHGFGGDASSRGDVAVAMQAPLSSGVYGGPARAAEGVVTRSAPLDGHLKRHEGGGERFSRRMKHDRGGGEEAAHFSSNEAP